MGIKASLLFGAVTVTALLLVGIPLHVVHAQTDEGFSLQVSPSPLVATVQPGTNRTLELQIRNTNSSEQTLKMGLRSFTIDDKSGQVKLGEAVPNEVKQMVTFATPSFSLEPGQIFTQKIAIHTDKNKGFSHNFAVTIAQQNPPKGKNGQSAIAGSVAVFTLITVDKPGAERKFELSNLSVTKHSYEYLPAEIAVKLKNTGNVNVQPTGTVFIQRNSNDSKPIATLPLNDSGGYIVPGATRTFSVVWDDGFPHYHTTQTGSTPTRELSWRDGGLSKIRFGRYVAKVVAIYNDGERDVPVIAEVSFWVVPWRIMFVVLLGIVVALVGVIVTVRSFIRTLRRASHKITHTSKKHEP